MDISQTLSLLLSKLELPNDEPPEAIPLEKPADPLERIALMRRIRGTQSSGFARLYGAKDIEQFIRQAQYMADFEDYQPGQTTAVSDMPTYTELSLRQLRGYFTWRTQFRHGINAPCPFAFALLNIFELLAGVTEAPEPLAPEHTARRIAETWLSLREALPRLDLCLPTWFKDFYLSRDFTCSFAELVRDCGLSRFYPTLQPLAGDEHGTRALLDNAGHRYRRSKFFLERPELCSLLEAAFPAVLRNLEPLFALAGIVPTDVLSQRPERFFYYELFRGAAARPPQAMPNREITIGPHEIYRCRSGNWSRAAVAEGGTPGGNAAVGCIVRRMEAVMREHFEYRYKLSPEASEGQLERWMHSESFPEAMHGLLADTIFAEIVDETTRQCCLHGGDLPGGGLIPRAQKLRDSLDAEPYKTLLRVKKIPGGNGEAAMIRQFQRQGALLAGLDDAFSEDVPSLPRQPVYGQLRHDQLRCYLTWRSAARQGEFRPAARGCAHLYCLELLFGIGTQDAFAELFSLLHHAAALDKLLERRLPGWIFDLWITGKREQKFIDLVRQHNAQPWYPLIFLDTDATEGDILPLWNQIASYKLLQSRFYDPEHHETLNNCFCATLEAVRRCLGQEGCSLEEILFTKRATQPNWFPFEGLRLKPHGKFPTAKTEIDLGPREAFFFHGRNWVTHKAAALTPLAAPFAGYLLKSMEVRLRELCHYTYKMSGAPEAALLRACAEEPELLTLLRSEALSRAISQAVDDYFAEHPLPRPRRQAKRNVQRAAVTEAPPKPPPPVKVDFSQLEQIRSLARATMERLIVETDETQPESAPPPAKKEPKPLGRSRLSLADTLNEVERAVIEYLRTGEGLPPPMDELMLERINEAALDLLGDTLIDTAGETPRLYEEYKDIVLQ